MFRDFLYQSYLKGVSTAKNIEPGNSGASSIPAINSGGLALSIGNDLAELLQKCLADTEGYYEISFTPTSAKRDEYHHLQIQIAKPGLKARTRESYYGLLSPRPKALRSAGRSLKRRATLHPDKSHYRKLGIRLDGNGIYRDLERSDATKASGIST